MNHEQQKQHYVMLSATHDFGLRGPFESSKAAADWGSRWQMDNADDPRWQCLFVSNEQIAEFRGQPLRAAGASQ